MAGLYYEQFSVGQTFVHEIRRTVTDMDNILFSSLTYNPAAVHIDHEYAKGTAIWGWKKPGFRGLSSPATPCAPRPRWWRCARASRARPRAL